MTLAEFFSCIGGYTDRLEDLQFLAASMTCYLMQPHLKKGKRITPHKLLGKKEPARLTAGQFKDPEQYRKAVERMAKDGG